MVFSLVRFHNEVDTRYNVWPQGYVVYVNTNTNALEATRMVECIKRDPDNVEGSRALPHGYSTFRPGDSYHEAPLFFQFLPFLLTDCNLDGLPTDDDVVRKVNAYKLRNRRFPLVNVCLTRSTQHVPPQSTTPRSITRLGGRTKKPAATVSPITDTGR